MAIIRSFCGRVPRIADGVFVAENAAVIGDVEISSDVSIWYGAVLRGDVGWIRIGARSNVQDLACLHMTTGVSNVIIGEEVTIGHHCTIHGARIGDGALIGMGSRITRRGRKRRHSTNHRAASVLGSRRPGESHPPRYR
jgi:gamma-carbonic anhydrase